MHMEWIILTLDQYGWDTEKKNIENCYYLTQNVKNADVFLDFILFMKNSSIIKRFKCVFKKNYVVLIKE